MTRIKNIPRVGWLVIGVVVTLLLVPTAAVAVGPLFTITGPSGNQADVTTAGQLLTAQAKPEDTWSADGIFGPNEGEQAFALPLAPSGEYLVVTQLQINTFADPSPGGNSFVLVNDDTNAVSGLNQWAVNGTNSAHQTLLAAVNPQSVGTTVIPISPPEPVFAFRFLTQIVRLSVDVQGISVVVTASGYFAPCSSTFPGPNSGGCD